MKRQFHKDVESEDASCYPYKPIMSEMQSANRCPHNDHKKTVKCGDDAQKSLKTLTEVITGKILQTSKKAQHADLSQPKEKLFKRQTIDETLNSEDNKLLRYFLTREFLLESPDQRPDDKDWLKLMLMKHSEDRGEFEKYVTEQSHCFTVIKQDPKIAEQTLLQFAAGGESEDDHSESLDHEPNHSIAQHFTELLDQMEYNKSLFSFIVGKLSTSEVKEELLLEIAEMLVEHSFNKETGAILPFHVLSSYMDDLCKEAKCSTDKSLVNQAVLNINATNYKQKPDNVSGNWCGWTALKISGKNNNVLDEHTLSMLETATEILQREKSAIYTLELEDIHAFMQNPFPTYNAFVQALYQCPKLVSVQLTNVDPGLIALLTKNLPTTVQRLSACADSQQTDAKGSYILPEEVNLRVLRLENCCSSVDDLFRHTKFPRLKELTLKDMMHKANAMRETSRWQTKDSRLLFDAILDDRTPKLEDMCIRFRCLQGCGRQIVKVLRQKALKTIELVGTRLNFDDGEILLNAIEEGFLDHLRFVNLLMNPGLNPLVEPLRRACNRRDILLQIAPVRNISSDTPTPDIQRFVSRVLKTSALNELHQDPQNGHFPT